MPKAKAKAEKKTTADKSDFFKTRKSRETDKDAGDTITPPEDIRQSIDSFRDAQEQMKHFEGEMTGQKDAINGETKRPTRLS